jgi:hypothetical protein
MKNTKHILLSSALVFGAGLFLNTTARAEAGCVSCAAATPISTSTDTFDLMKAKASYPLDTCVVSGEKLEGGDMGGPVDYIHKEEGKPDRLVRFCCKSCIKKFKKDPAKYLKVIDDAVAAQR